jgi:hypothetical protein
MFQSPFLKVDFSKNEVFCKEVVAHQRLSIKKRGDFI